MRSLHLLSGISAISLSLWSLQAFSSQGSMQTSDQVELHYVVKGNGPYCLYLHGGPGSGSYWMEKFAGDILEKHFTMIYLDQRGVGRSVSAGDQNYCLDRMVEDFEELRRHLSVEKWLTLGHSFGGILQMGYVEKYPERQLGMLMFNAALNFQDCGKASIPKPS